jgi:hypothetical protein
MRAQPSMARCIEARSVRFVPGNARGIGRPHRRKNAECADKLAALGGDVSAALRRWVREVLKGENKVLRGPVMLIRKFVVLCEILAENHDRRLSSFTPARRPTPMTFINRETATSVFDEHKNKATPRNRVSKTDFQQHIGDLGPWHQIVDVLRGLEEPFIIENRFYHA